MKTREFVILVISFSKKKYKHNSKQLIFLWRVYKIKNKCFSLKNNKKSYLFFACPA